MSRPEDSVCWWVGDGPLAVPMFEPPSWYIGHLGDFRWVEGLLEGLPDEEREVTLTRYGEIYQRDGRRAANEWLRVEILES